MGFSLSKSGIRKYAEPEMKNTDWELKECPVCNRLVPVNKGEKVEHSKHWQVLHGGDPDDLGFKIIDDFQLEDTSDLPDGERSGIPCPKCGAELAYYPAGTFADNEDIRLCERCNYMEGGEEDESEFSDEVVDCLRCGGDMGYDDRTDEWVCEKCGNVERDPESCPKCSETLEYDPKLDRFWCPNCAEYVAAGPSATETSLPKLQGGTKDCPRCDAEMYKWSGEQNTYWVCDNCGKIEDANQPPEKKNVFRGKPNVFGMYEKRDHIMANQITPQIWLGDVVNGWLMRDRKTGKPFDAILNVSQHNYTPPPDVEYAHDEIDEYTSGPYAALKRRQTLEKAVNQLEKWVSEGKKVYVHCSEGMNRSPSVIAALLYKQQLKEAESQLSLLPSGKPEKPVDKERVYDDVLQEIQNKRTIAMPYGDMEDALRAILKLPKLQPMRYTPKQTPAAPGAATNTPHHYKKNDYVTVPVDMGRRRVPGKIIELKYPSLDESAKGKRPEYVVSFDDNGIHIIDSFPIEALRPAPGVSSGDYDFLAGERVWAWMPGIGAARGHANSQWMLSTIMKVLGGGLYEVKSDDGGSIHLPANYIRSKVPDVPQPKGDTNDGRSFRVGDQVMVPWGGRGKSEKGEIVNYAGPGEYLVQVKDRKHGLSSIIKFDESQIVKLRKQKQRRYFDPEKNVMQTHPKFPPPGGIEKKKKKKKALSRKSFIRAIATRLAKREMPRRGGKNIIANFLRRAINENELFDFYVVMQLPPQFYSAFPKWETYAKDIVDRVAAEYAKYLEQLARTEAEETYNVSNERSDEDYCDHDWSQYNESYHECDNCGRTDSHDDWQDESPEEHRCGVCGYTEAHDFNRNHYCFACAGDYDHNWAISGDQEYTCVSGEDESGDYVTGCGATSENIEQDQEAPFFGDYYAHNHQHEFTVFRAEDSMGGEGVRCALCGRAYISEEDVPEQMEMGFPSGYNRNPSQQELYNDWKRQEVDKYFKMHEADPSLHEWEATNYTAWGYTSYTSGYTQKVDYRCKLCNKPISVAIVPADEWHNEWPAEGVGPDTYGDYASKTGEPPQGIVVKPSRQVEQYKKDQVRLEKWKQRQQPRETAPRSPHSPEEVYRDLRKAPTRPTFPSDETQSPASQLMKMKSYQLSFRSIVAAPRKPNPLKQKWDRRRDRENPRRERKKKEMPQPTMGNIDTSKWFDFNVQDPESGRWIPWATLRSQYRPSEWRMLEKALIESPESVLTGLAPAGGRLQETVDTNRLNKFKNMIELKKRLVGFTPNQIRQSLKRLEKYSEYLRTDADDIFLTITGLKSLFDNKKPDELDMQAYRDIQPELKQAWDMYVKVLSKKDKDMAEFYARHPEPPKPEWGSEATVETNQVQIAKGTGSSPGKATGRVATSAAAAIELASDGRPVILVRPETTPEDIAAMKVSAAFLTAFGGPTAHAAIVARQMGKPCVVNAGFTLTAEGVQFGEHLIRNGDVISLDGSSGLVSVREKVSGEEEEPELTPAPAGTVHVDTEDAEGEQDWDTVFQEVLDMEHVLKSPGKYDYDRRDLENMDLFDLAQVFQKSLHEGSYGGPRWALAAMRAKQLQEIIEKEMPWRYKGMLVDQINTLQHNSGNIFEYKPWPGNPGNWINRVLDTKGSEHAMLWMEQAMQTRQVQDEESWQMKDVETGDRMLSDQSRAMLRDYRMWARRSGYPSLYGTDVSNMTPEQLRELKKRELEEIRRRRKEEQYKYSFAGPGRVALIKIGKTVIAFHKVAGARLAVDEHGVQNLHVPDFWRGRGVARELAEAMKRIDDAA